VPSEVERARKLIQDSLKGYKIKSVDAKEDKIVYTGGTDHAEFVSEICPSGAGDMSR
jgi:formamidopyrimidine-DNA glycosylase